MPNVPVQNGQLPQGFCPPDYQTILNAFSAAQFVTLAGISSGFVVSATPPADHTVGWLQLDSLGRPVRLYFFAQGAWLSQHPLPPGFTMLWNLGLPNFQTFDGGDSSAAPYSPLSGQMWQLMSTTQDGLGTQVLQAQFPVGVGNFVLSGAVVVTGAGGEDKHILTPSEGPPHTHPENIAINRAVPAGGQTDPSGNGGFVGPIGLGGSEIFGKTALGDPSSGNPPTLAQPHNNLPPWYGVYFLQRTNRLFYVVHP